MFDFIGTLSESRLVPSQTTLRNFTAQDLSELAVLYVCALYILSTYEDSESVAYNYAKRTVQYGSDFEKWRVSANDLYAILYGLMNRSATLKNPHTSDPFREHLPLNIPSYLRWLKALGYGDGNRISKSTHRFLFSRLDNNFKINNSSIRAVRRAVMDWEDLDAKEKRLTMTRLMQLMQIRAPKSELLPALHKVAAKHDLQIDGLKSNTPDYLAPGHDEKRRGSLLLSLAGIAAGVGTVNALARKNESASCGATGAASVAAAPTAIGGIGVGFDPNGDKGVYQGAKKKKPLILRR